MNNFGTTLLETTNAFRPKMGEARSDLLNAWARIVFSAILLIVGLCFSPDGAEKGKLGMTLIGLVAGYWLK